MLQTNFLKFSIYLYQLSNLPPIATLNVEPIRHKGYSNFALSRLNRVSNLVKLVGASNMYGTLPTNTKLGK